MPIKFPFAEPPKPLEMIEAAEGIFWLRLPLPFRLDHVNIYLVEDGGGYALIDTGIDNSATRALWEALFEGPLRDKPLTRVIATHSHPDHIGLAGWLCERFGVPLLASETEYLVALTIRLDPSALDAEPYRSFYLSHGLSEAHTQLLLSGGLYYLRMVSSLPRTFRRVIAGETLRIGGRDFSVMTGGGHSPEQVMLYCAAQNVLLAADQALAKISPNISVSAMDPDGDPLGIYLRSLESLKQTLPEDVVVLPGHNLPFTGLSTRTDELAAHHEARCEAILQACAKGPRSVADLVPVVFGRTIDDPHQMGFAFSEALAHANYLVRRGALRVVKEAGGALLETV
ncbi:MAG TPA: MBL fold metallo-hydrolase [Roseiarcus sp.]|jgi:glyoxylase-like metal-dependent hydrolase (beta-lactamase superfamily II)